MQDEKVLVACFLGSHSEIADGRRKARILRCRGNLPRTALPGLFIFLAILALVRVTYHVWGFE